MNVPKLMPARLSPPSDGSVGQLLLLAHHRHAGDLTAVSDLRVQAAGWRAGGEAFRRPERDGRRDGALLQPSRRAAVRDGRPGSLMKTYFGTT